MSGRPDLTVVIVSYNDRQWLTACLSSVREQVAEIAAEVIVVDNGSDGAHHLVEATFPDARTLVSENHGFGHANNRAIADGTGRYVLFLNPDTELLQGSLRDVIAALDARPDIGVAGVRQVTADGTLWPTIRYFPCFTRALGDALGAERVPRRPRWAGERELDPELYDQETECDWTSGSFMLIRREALLSAGLFDERFFVYSEEPDLCLRIKRAGWRVVHLPDITIVHHAGKSGVQPRMRAQDAYTRLQYARKHFNRAHRYAYLAAIASGYVARTALGRGPHAQAMRSTTRLVVATLSGSAAPPFAGPPTTALPPYRREVA
jgi:N-acetylglucosaminyl-diphospho-decaprenol L-rhamnosyltransferase